MELIRDLSKLLAQASGRASCQFLLIIAALVINSCVTQSQPTVMSHPGKFRASTPCLVLENMAPETHADNLETCIPLWLGHPWGIEAKLENSLVLGARQSQQRQAGPEPSMHTDFAPEWLGSCKQGNTEE